MSWAPIFDNSESITFYPILDFISKSFEINLTKTTNDLLVGKVGIGLYWHQLFLLRSEKTSLLKSHATLETSLEASGGSPDRFSFCSGLSGKLWALCFLKEQGLIEIDLESIIEKGIEDYVISNSLNALKNGDYDFLHGGSGVTMYLLCRKEKPECNKALRLVIEYLGKTAIKREFGIAWGRKNHDNEWEINFGLAHGIPSVIVILSKLFNSKIDTEKTRNLLESSVSYLLALKMKGEQGYYFPNNVTEKGLSRNTRLAWCYGDLGISMALLQAGQALENMKWINEAVNIARNSCSIRDIEKTGIKDVCFCHGSIGVAHIFNRYYQLTHDSEFLDAARFWFLETAKFFQITNHLKSFKPMNQNEFGWEEELGILGGNAGIGLAVISAIGSIEPKWDRCLLLS